MTRRVGGLREWRRVPVCLPTLVLCLIGSTTATTPAQALADQVVGERPAPTSAIRFDLPRPLLAPGRLGLLVTNTSTVQAGEAASADLVRATLVARLDPLSLSTAAAGTPDSWTPG